MDDFGDYFPQWFVTIFKIIVTKKQLTSIVKIEKGKTIS